jgi:hypothetical protein
MLPVAGRANGDEPAEKQAPALSLAEHPPVLAAFTVPSNVVQVADGVEVAVAPVKWSVVSPGMTENACRPVMAEVQSVVKLFLSEVPVVGASVICNSVGVTASIVKVTPWKVQGLAVETPPSAPQEATADASEAEKPNPIAASKVLPRASPIPLLIW